MKNSKLFLIVIAALVTGAFLMKDTLAQRKPAAAPASTRVAVCDVIQVFNNYKRSQDLSAQLNQKRQQTALEEKKRVKEINALQMELTALKQGSPEYEKRVQKLQKLTIDVKVWKQFQEALIMSRHHKLTKDLYQEILATVARVAKEKNFQVVIYGQRSDIPSKNTPQLLQMIEFRKVLYSAPGLDLTDTVLDRLNRNYHDRNR